MVKRLIVFALVAAGCGGGIPTSFGINVTLDASSLSSNDLARISTARLTVSGAENYTKSFDISKPIKTGEVRFRYIPKMQTGELTLAVDVSGSANEIVASGVGDPVVIVANKAGVARIVLGAPPVDMSALDAATDGGDDASTPVDLAQPAIPDLAPTPLNCLGMGKCVYDCLNAGSDLNTCDTRCSPKTKPGSASKWNNAVVCGQDYCIADADMKTGRCVEVADPGNPNVFVLCDPGITYAQCTAQTYVSTSCLPCLDQARNPWIYDTSTDPAGPPTGMCSMPTSADCMGAKAMCMTQFNACLNDL